MKNINKTKKGMIGLAACAIGVLINIAGTKVAAALSLPFYLDAVGTVLVASLCGYLPGILVGLLNNAINGISDLTSAYYGAISMLIALMAAWFSRRKYEKKPGLALLAVLVFALIGGGLGSVFTWLLNGMDFGAVISTPLARSIYEGGVNSVFLAQLIADFTVDLGDKAITTLLVVLIMRLLPQPVHDALNVHRWRDVRRNRGMVRSVSLGTKIMVYIAAAVLFITLAVTMITVHQFNEAAMDNQYILGESIVKVAASLVDGNRVDEFINKGTEAEGYQDIKNELTIIKNSTPDIEYVYVYRILEDGCHVVFDLDTEELPGEAPGTIVDFDMAFADYLPDLLAGSEIDPVVSDETYGWLLTFYYPVYDDAGVCQCYAAVDISMPKIMVAEQIFLTRTVSLFLNFFILLLCGGVYLANNYIVKPINEIAHAAQSFDYTSAEERQNGMKHLQRLNIQTGDEIENLYQSFVKSSSEIMRYIEEDHEKSEKITRLQNGLIMILADVVESRDKCTGDHVRKTAAYVSILMEQMRKDGIYADQLTDTFISDVVHSAPLHDVGKIHISDVVLNSPARLTPEEYAIMKEHTTIGAEIIRNAIDTVSNQDTSYLKEAQNLAHFHHERWDGKGYPEGLKGEEIPLSARVMAVADVFDALYSKRSYKTGFSWEKSVGIIEEGAGTQFDPNVVLAFEHALEEVRKVADMNRSKEV